ncbi:MAG: DNA repair protein RadA [Chloroflexi bacterium]|nr:DNA repair protein RadA [Chloroflexota bacterium]
MAKTRTQYVCQQCGRTAAKPLGRCPQCGEWNSMVEELLNSGRTSVTPASGLGPKRLTEIDVSAEERLPMDNSEFARVLGGGVVPGSLVLIGGDPGIGKSTLLLQVSADVAAGGPVLYVSGEESVAQIKSRALRVSNGAPPPENLYLATETDVDRVIGQIESVEPRLAIIDSIQTLHSADIGSAAGSISQVRECASRLQAVAKSSGVAIFLVGHVTKDGAIAGPRVLEHLVDTVLYLEGDPYHSYRLLRSVKNRYGATTEVGVFKMGTSGMVEVANPSEAFLAERRTDAPGSAIAVTMEGSRPLLVEVQGLTSPTTFGHPRRTANGVDTNRLLIITAVLTRRVGIQLSDQDIFVNVVGGLQVKEPAADLALATAIASSARDRALPPDLALIGEIGLSGELRRVPHLEPRLREAVKLGFSSVVLPKGADLGLDLPSELEGHEVTSLSEALEFALRT